MMSHRMRSWIYVVSCMAILGGVTGVSSEAQAREGRENSPRVTPGTVEVSDGRVYVLDREQSQILIMGANARYLVTIPLNTICGEPVSLKVDDKQEFWVLDELGWVFQLTSSGELINVYSVPDAVRAGMP